jgi:hypothetical protein
MTMKKGRKVQRLIRLNSKNNNFVEKLPDPFVRELPRLLKNFSEFPTGNLKYDWKVLDDDGFVSWFKTLKKSELIKTNRVKISYMIRNLEAFQFASVWRMTDLITATVNILNNDTLIAGAATSRSAIELTTRYVHASHFFDKYFRDIPWDKLDTHLLELQFYGNPGDAKSLKLVEHEIDRLMWGSRLEETIDFNPELEQTNILTLIRKIDKTIRADNESSQIMPHYEFLSEAAHPNGLGFKRFQEGNPSNIDDIWISLKLSERASGDAADFLRSEIMWGLAFSAYHIPRCFQIFYKLGEFVQNKMGVVLPPRRS